MTFDPDLQYIVGQIVDLRLIGTYEGNESELPFYWFEIVAKDSGAPVGKISIRIGDNFHAHYNGNIGYEVDEAFRGHHYALHACRMVLEIARSHGMRRLYLTCDADNASSYKTIERLGARLIETVVPPRDYVFYYEGIPAHRIYLLEL